MSGGTVTTGNIPRLLQEGLARIFDQAYNEHPPEWDKIFDSETSRKAFELDQQVENFDPAVFKPQGEDITFDSFQQGYTPQYKHLTAAKGFIVTKEAMADDLYGVIRQQTRSLAFAMTQLKEITGANVLNNGFDPQFTQPGGDGSPLFASDHIAGPSGLTYANQLDVPADLSEAAIEDLLIQISEATDTRGNQIAIMPIRLIVPPALAYETQRILGSVLQNDTGNNATNAMRDMNAIPNGHVVNHYLTDPSAWFIKTNAGGNPGMTHWNRQSVEFGRDNAFSSGNMRQKADERYSFGWSNPKGMYGSAGSA